MDDSRPGNKIPVTGKDIRNVFDCVLTSKKINRIKNQVLAVILNGKTKSAQLRISK